jgi:hypothetical protein
MGKTMKKMCNICADDCKEFIQCRFCDFEVCKVCTTKYLLESINEPHCMNCKKNWDREFLIKSISLSWYDGKYKPSRKQVLFDREKSLFTESLPYAKLYKKLDKLTKEYDKVSKESNKLYLEKQKLLLECRMTTDKNEKKNIRTQVLQKNAEYGKMRSKRNVISNEMYYTQRQINNIGNGGGGTDTTKEVVVQEKYYGKCFDEKCIGLLSKNGKCVTCEKLTCTKCLEKSEENHECNPDTLETVKLIKQDTKACPKCFIAISKVSGCYQMWCTNCHTTFHYNTGEILEEKIHNPHYIEWLNSNRNKNRGGGECGGDRLDLIVYRLAYPTKKIATSMHNIMREILHIDGVLIANIRHKLNNITNNRDIRYKRCMYMLNIIPEEKFKMQLFQRYKQTMRWNDFLNFFTFMKTGMTAIIEEYLATKKFDVVHNQLDTLYKYCKEESDRLRDVYQNNIGINSVFCEDEVIKFTDFYMNII